MKYTAEQVRQFYWRRPAPTQVPVAGDRVLFRSDEGATPVLVDVVKVGPAVPDDPNVYGPGARHDPAPLVTFRRPGSAVLGACREARVPGQPGWMWPGQILPETLAGVADVLNVKG